MKAACYTLAGALLLACLSAHAQTQPQKSRSVYLQIKGPEESAAKLRSLFAEVATDKDLFIVDDRHDAASKVNVSIEERKVQKPLYAEVVAATLLSHDGKSFPLYSCKKVTDSEGYSTVTTKSGKANMPKDEPVKKRVWIEKGSARADLLEAVHRELINADFQVVDEETTAEFTLKDIHVIKQSLKADAVEARVESVVSPGKGPTMTIGGNLRFYLAVMEPLSAEAESCRDSLRHLSDNTFSYHTVAAMDLDMIARNIK